MKQDLIKLLTDMDNIEKYNYISVNCEGTIELHINKPQSYDDYFMSSNKTEIELYIKDSYADCFNIDELLNRPIDIKEQIKEEFKALLDKYNLSIGFECSDCSDLMGVYDPQIVISKREGTKEIDIIKSDDYYLTSKDIE